MTIWYDEKNDVIAVTMPLPSEVAEAVTPNEDGTHTVIVNDRIGHAAAKRAYEHALQHIREGDFDAADVQAVERRAHASA